MICVCCQVVCVLRYAGTVGGLPYGIVTEGYFLLLYNTGLSDGSLYIFICL